MNELAKKRNNITINSLVSLIICLIMQTDNNITYVMYTNSDVIS